MKRCANPGCGHVEEVPYATYCAICGGRLVDVVGPGGRGTWGEMGYEVYLFSPGERIINTIRVIRQYTGLGLKEAKDIVDGAPRAVCTGVTQDVAKDMRKALEDIGARAEVRAATAVGEVRRDSGNPPGYTVILNDPGSEKIDVIKVIRQHTTLGLKEAKVLVDSAPGAVSSGLTKEAAEMLKKELEAAGAAAEARSGYSGYDRREVGSLTTATADTHPQIPRGFQSAPIEPGKSRLIFRSCLDCLMILLVFLIMIVTLV